MDFNEILKKIKTKFLKFWRSTDGKISLIRDIFIALILVLIILTALWAYTGQWFGAPMVAIESGSMMHENEPFGRLGTIDAGDMVFLVKVDSISDIVTRAAKDPNNYNYGDYGDVIVYRPYGKTDRDQIIHRAIYWVDYYEETGTYSVQGDPNNQNVTSINKPEIGLHNYVPENPHSGYITKGDNPKTNTECDQVSREICLDLIRIDWVSGKARGELPWIGTLNLLFNDIIGGKSTVGNVPSDCIICLVILIIILISIPISLDLYSYYKEKKESEKN
ncbi:signal peptidase I [Thermoplasmatales archaeon SG8-52-4]|nr:MAG: signal peptidase I [Thermoplasmatales archaeon SG8-52-4]